MDILQLAAAALKLKEVFRTGWKRSGVDRPESVADHTFGVVFLSMLLGDHLHLDTEKMMKMALIHDIAECKLGDIHYESLTYLGEEEVQKAGEKAARDILPERYFDLWKELSTRQSQEACIVSACDKLELYFQALHYEQVGYRSMGHFWANPWNTKDFTPEVQELFERLKAERSNLSE